MTGHPQQLLLVANARLPSQRAQSLQVAQVAGAFSRAGWETTLLHARRQDTPPVEDLGKLWDYYGLPGGPRPALRTIPNLDCIDRVPRALQYVPARAQELTFSRNAARVIRAEFPGARVLSRELECARRLVLSGRPGVFLEVHRVPGGRTRRRWLVEASLGLSGVVAISRGVRDDLVQLGLDPDKIRIEHDGFEARRFADLPSRKEARRELGLEAHAQVVVYTGGLLAWKGVDVLVEAARRLPGIQFLIAGGMDADVQALSSRAGDLKNVRFDGFQPPERVACYLVAGDLGVVPNRSEPAISSRYTSPLKIFEARAVGLPLVVSDLPSMRDVLDPEEAVFVAPDLAEDLAVGIRELLGDEVRRSAMARRMREQAPEHTWDARAERLLEWMGRCSGT